MNCDIQRKQTAEKIWLHYFNDVLFQKGVISERDRNKMALKIESRKSSSIDGLGKKTAAK